MLTLDAIMSKRPTYKSLPILQLNNTNSVLHHEQPLLTDRSIHINRVHMSANISVHKSTPKSVVGKVSKWFKPFVKSKRDSFSKVDEAFNQIRDFTKKDQILLAIKKLTGIDQRVQLLDKILKRREEMTQASLLFQMEKLAPIFKIIQKKLKKVEDPPPQLKSVRQGGRMLTFQRKEQEVELEGINELNQELEGRQKELMEKLAQKFTSSLAMKLFAKKTPQEIEIEACSPRTQRRKERQSTQLRMVQSQDQKFQNQLVVKIKENSHQFQMEGRQLGVDYLKRKSMRDVIKEAKPKVDSHQNKYISSDQMEVITSTNLIEHHKNPRRGIKYKHVLFQ